MSQHNYTDQDYLTSYERKKESCEKRGITFSITFSQYKALMKSREKLKCAYTGAVFSLKKKSGATNDNYPSMERIDENKGYERGNIVFVTAKANSLKATYIENEKSLKGISDTNLGIIRKIQKTLGMPEILQKRIEVYDDIFDKADDRDEEIKVKQEREEIKNKKALEEERLQKVRPRYNEERYIAEVYLKWLKEFEQVGKLFELTIKEVRDILRSKTCRITNTVFDDDDTKSLYVVDKSLPITKDNVILCNITAREALDHLQKLGPVLPDVKKFIDKKY